VLDEAARCFYDVIKQDELRENFIDEWPQLSEELYQRVGLRTRTEIIAGLEEVPNQLERVGYFIQQVAVNPWQLALFQVLLCLLVDDHLNGVTEGTQNGSDNRSEQVFCLGWSSSVHFIDEAAEAADYVLIDLFVAPCRHEVRDEYLVNVLLRVGSKDCCTVLTQSAEGIGRVVKSEVFILKPNDNVLHELLH